jgi:ParB/RepB/Spo0J family partition protein
MLDQPPGRHVEKRTRAARAARQVAPQAEQMTGKRCTDCGDLNQAVKKSIYSIELGRCPRCGNPEFSPIFQESFAMASIAVGTLSPQTKSRAKKPAAKAELVMAASEQLPEPVVVPTGQLRSIRIELMMPDPKNPRDEIDPDGPEIIEMAATIVLVGLAQPILVRPAPAGMFFIIAGHRRYFGCKRAGLAVVDCMVRECTEEQWAILQIIENTQRKDLSPVEEAHSFKNAMATLGIGPTELARRIGRSQGYISQRMGMLKLPPRILKWIKEGVLTFSQCRPLGVVSDLPDTMGAFITSIEHSLEYFNKSGVASNADVDDAFSGAVQDTMGCMSDDFQGPKFKATPEQLDALDVREVEVEGDRGMWAANIDLYTELNFKARQAIESERQLETKQTAVGKQKSPATISKAELKKRQEEAAAVLNKRVYRWYISWLQGKILDRVQAGGFDEEMRLIWLIALSTAADGGSMPRLELLSAGSEAPFEDTPWAYHERWKFVYGLDRGKIGKTLQNWFEAWCKLPAKSSGTDAHPAVIEILGRELGIDVLKQFQVTEEFLKLHSIEQLQILGKEWCLTIAQKAKKADWVGMCLKESASCSCPTELKNVKAVALD